MSGKGPLLIALARAAIAEQLAIPYAIPFAASDIQACDWLQQQSASFVTLHIDGNLRGCIGSLKAYRPLMEDVRSNAVHAAFQDPRFAPLSPEEFERIDIEVSLLTAATPIHFSSEADALQQLRPHIDGVILNHEYHSATFLPQVWEQLPTPETFMQHLKQKAGLPAGFWSDDVQLSRYEVEKFSENDGKAGGQHDR